MYENLLYEVHEQNATITINRPDKLNALNAHTIREINLALNAAIEDKRVRVIFLTGSGQKAFVAGADISEFDNLNEDQAVELSASGHHVFSSIEKSSKPVIAAVNGFALGGGCELALACHLRIASDNAKFGFPEVKLGLIPGYGGTQRLTRLIGQTKAIELMITTDMMSAADALQAGLVNAVVPQQDLMHKCLEIAAKIGKQAPLAVAGVIKCVNEAYHADNGFKTEIKVFGKCFSTNDSKEGILAFQEKRNPVFQGN
jgi:enoyl-CoA hydratase